MNDGNKLDLGSVKIHKKVLAEIVYAAIQDLPGVRLVSDNLRENLERILGLKKHSGISVIVNKSNQVSINVKLVIEYGKNIPDVAQQAQDIIRNEIEKTVDIDLKDINVNIQGIERGKS